MKKVLLLLLVSLTGLGQNYDAHRSMAENPSYILEEYSRIVKNDSGQVEMLHYTKYFFQGSTMEQKEYILGTPFYLDHEWHKGFIKITGQKEVTGYLSYDQVFQRVYYKQSPGSRQRILVNPEYFIINDVTFYSFPQTKNMMYTYFTKIKTEGLDIFTDNKKVQSDNINFEIKDSYNIDDSKYKAVYKSAPSYYIFKKQKGIKVEDKNQFYKNFGSSKKEVKTFLEKNNIDFSIANDVISVLNHLSNQ